eukprot:TRINITY_DN1638_c0_g1_i2.p1 TRINITY_DN1638_c0_g1~~TRINITY_DN1638_c0_g1_i2.p1  ORF type:complete len:128 (-),score=23.78 TRINITY_DN1638_c0_g1_i2:34-417(-)
MNLGKRDFWDPGARWFSCSIERRKVCVTFSIGICKLVKIVVITFTLENRLCLMQWWYVISGEMLLAVEDVETKQREVFTMKTGMRVTIGGKIAHAVRGIEKCQVIESNGNEVYDSNDTFPYHVSFEK